MINRLGSFLDSRHAGIDRKSLRGVKEVFFFSPSDVDEAVIESQKYIRFVFTDTSRYVVFTSTPDGAYPAA